MTHTNVITESGLTKMYYHKTSVVQFNDKIIVLDTGGWKTNTTKKRMNQASEQYNIGFEVYQKAKKWFVKYQGDEFPYNDHMVLSRS